MIRVHVEGGIGAGVREPYRGNAEPWTCRCWSEERGPRINAGYLARCEICGEKRP